MQDRGLDGVLLRTLQDQLIEQSDIDMSKLRIDSTTMRSSNHRLTRLGIRVEATSKFPHELKRRDAELFETIDSEIVSKYVE